MKNALVPLLILALWLGACGQSGQGTGPGQADQGAIRVALGDIESVETLALFIALEHVRERGVEVEINELADEDIANQAVVGGKSDVGLRSEEHTSELQSRQYLVCRLLLEKKKKTRT